MKQTIVLFLFLLPLLAAAQEVTFDTTYLSQQNGVYYVVQRVEFDNGEYEEKARQLGDSTQTAQFLTNTAVNEQQALTRAAVTVIRQGKVKQRYNQLDALMKALNGGTDLYKVTNAQYYPQFEGAWVLKQAGVETALTTNQQANGNVRFLDAGNTAYQFRIYSPYNIQLRGWQGQNWDLYSEDGKLFQDLNKIIRLKK
jgi:hypothetical protein